MNATAQWTSVARLDRTNKYPGKCCVCGVRVPAQRGYLLSRDDVPERFQTRSRWLTSCTTLQCCETLAGKGAVEEADRRALLADGRVVMPYDEEALSLLRAFSTWDGSAWRASMLLRDRDHVLALAERLDLDIAPELLEYVDPPRVQAAMERARAVDTIRPYQLEGVRFLSYASSTHGCTDSGRRDRKGRILAGDPGTGKTLQTLLSVDDSEGVVVVGPANAKAVWPREVAKWRPGRFDTITMCDGRESFRWPSSPRELVVINYDVLPYTKAQIAAEADRLTTTRYGRDPDPRGTTKKERAGVVGLLTLACEVAEQVNELRHREGQTTSVRHTIFELRTQLIDLAAKLKRNRRALLANSKRKPAPRPPCPVLLVGDEAHYVENNKAQRTVRWRRLAELATRVYGLTGTPIESEPLKAWGLFQSCNCNPFTWTSFKRQFNAFDGAWGGLDFLREAPRPGSTGRGAVKVEPGTVEMIQRVLLRHRKEDVLKDLPPKVYSEIPVALPENLVRELDEITAECADLLLAGELPPFDKMAAVRKALAAACIPAMLDEVSTYEQAGVPLIVFSAHRAPIDKLAKREGWHTITGSTSSKKRGEIEDEFQAGQGVGVAGTRAMAEAMTLTRASTVLFVDRFWERKYNRQAEGRPHRVGQRDTVHIVTLVPDHPLTWHCAELLRSKDAFVDATLHDSTGYEAQPSKFVTADETEWNARVLEQQRRTEEAEQRARAKREREIAGIASREVTPKQAEQRAKLRAERLGIIRNESELPPLQDVQDALAHMLSICDGAVEKDNVGFNKPDGCVARWLVPAVAAGLPFAVASAVQILRHYPRQLAADFPTLFTRVS